MSNASKPTTTTQGGVTSVQFSTPDDVTDMLLTPGGYRHKSLVHHVEHGNTLDGTGDRIVQRDATKKVVADHGIVKRREGGKPLMPGNVNVPDSKRLPLGSGWITYADWTNNAGYPLTMFSATWRVPPPPSTDSGQTIFLFNGVQNSTMIYQPVLQWGFSAAGGGNYWSVGSWYVDGQGGMALHSTLTPVGSGQLLIGVMYLVDSSGSLFSYGCEFLGIPNSQLPISNVEQLTWLIITLEAYGVTNVTDYPNIPDTPFTGIVVQTGDNPPNIVWNPVNVVTDVGQHTVVLNNAYGDGFVVLFYV
jgi:hypothetical protein